MARRNQYEEELEGVIAQVAEARRKASQREQGLQRQIAQLGKRLGEIEEEEELMQMILKDKDGGGTEPAVPMAAEVPAETPSPAVPKPATPAPAAPKPVAPAPAKED